ncbi:MAG: pyridoxal phosphate-dependent decarboxylase family protein [Actinomycetota bacterium]
MHPEPELIDFRDPVRARAALEQLAERTLVEALDWLYGEAMRRPTAPDLYSSLREDYYGPSGEPGPAPAHGTTSEEVLAEFHERLAPYLYAAQHPGSFSYFTPPPLPMSIVGETLAAWTNQSSDVWLAGMAGPFVEEEVVRWLCDLIGYGTGSWGVLTSGGVMANVMGLTVGRDIHLAKLLGLDEPPRGAQLENVRVYASDQAHYSIKRGLDILGFPEATLRVVPSDDRFRLHAELVAAAIADDRVAGLTPFCITPVAGSTNTGSVDLIGELADLAEREGLWLHVDAAYGGAVRLSPRDADRVTDLERADSLTIDPHKWFFQPYDIGALLVKRRENLLHTFHGEPEYYRVWEPEDEPLHWYQYSLEGTRRFRALKLWMSWKHLGTEGFASLIEHNVDLSAYFTRRLHDEGFDVVDPELSVVCFRHVPAALASAAGSAIDAYQKGLQRALEVSGAGWVSTTTLRGRTYLRAGIVNYLSTEEDADRVVDTLLGASERVLEQLDLGAAGT